MKLTASKNRFSIVCILLLGVLPAFFSACDAQIKDSGAGTRPQSTPPRLANLVVQNADGPLAFTKKFNSETLSYTVPTPAVIEPVTINAVVAASNAGSYAISYLPAKQLTPLAGTVAAVNVLDRGSGLKETYIITFDGDNLTPAAISDLYFSIGTLQTPIDEETFEYMVNVPRGTQSVMLLPVGAQPNTYFTYNEGTNPVVELSPDGTGSVVVGVMAQNYSPSSYTINFQLAANTTETFSKLNGIALSRGALAGPFITEPEDEAIQIVTVSNETASLAVTAIKSLWSDATFFDSAADPSDRKVFTITNGLTFTIRVSSGGDSLDREYKFKINVVNKPDAALNALSFTGTSTNVDTMVYRRHPSTGKNNGVGFSAADSEYNLNFTVAGETAVISAEVNEGFTIAVTERSDITSTISGNGTMASIAASSLQSHLSPVEITVSGGDYTQRTYYVYFFHKEPPQAYLTSLAVIGGMVSSIPPLNEVNTITDRTVNLLANTESVIVQGTAAAGFTVRYNPPGGFLTGSLSSSSIEIVVSGGPGYIDGTYRLFFNVNAAQTPRLTALNINGIGVQDFSNDKLVYEYVIENDEAGNIDIPFDWEHTTNEVNHISYSLDSGSNWTTDASGFAPPPTISLGALETKAVLIKVRTIDGGEAVYFVTVKRTSAFKITALSITDIAGLSQFETASSLSPAVSYYPITVSNNTSLVKLWAQASPGAAVRAEVNNSPYAFGSEIPLQVCEPKTIILSVYQQNVPTQTVASYTFAITRERPAGLYIDTNTTPVYANLSELFNPPLAIHGIELGEGPGGDLDMPPPEEEPGEDAETGEETPEDPPPVVEEPPPDELQPVETLAAALAWLASNAQDNTAYTLILGASTDSPPVALGSTAFNTKNNVTFTLGAVNNDTVVSLPEGTTGPLFTVHSGVHFVLDRNISLRGGDNNTSSVVHLTNPDVENTCYPTLEMKEGSKIFGNQVTVNTSGGGITVGDKATFTMRGGQIRGNYAVTNGGGIYSAIGSHIQIYGGLIADNTAVGNGGGIYIGNTLHMDGGLLKDNEAGEGGGIYITNGSAVIRGGSIISNEATFGSGNGGGGIYIYTGSSVNFSGGTIKDNTTQSSIRSDNVFGMAHFNNSSGQIITGIY
ncbi:MAG: hypothetical protein LBD20_09075 [Spirochaetaceae bacterium]|jgi:hypothetical protein|nr:hypothetical protein [Spirochaetaceae bacterium]